MGGSLGIFDDNSAYNEWDGFESALKNNSITRINPYYYPAKFEGKNLEEALDDAKKFPFKLLIVSIIVFTIVKVFFMTTDTLEIFSSSLGMLLGASAFYVWISRQLRIGNYVVHILPKPKKPVYASSGGGGYSDSGGGGFFYGDGGAGAAVAISCGDGGGAC